MRLYDKICRRKAQMTSASVHTNRIATAFVTGYGVHAQRLIKPGDKNRDTALERASKNDHGEFKPKSNLS